MTFGLIWLKQLVRISNNMENIHFSLYSMFGQIIIYNNLLLGTSVAVPMKLGPGRKTALTPITMNLKFSDLYRFSLCP